LIFVKKISKFLRLNLKEGLKTTFHTGANKVLLAQYSKLNLDGRSAATAPKTTLLAHTKSQRAR
jgi:hypothetical protein